MKVTVAYIYPMVQGRKYFPLAMRFAQTYKDFPAGYDHQLVVICNGRAANENELRMFERIPHEIIVHNNTGWDIGAFQYFAEVTKADLLVCLGSNTHFHRAGWLSAMVDAYTLHGAGLYGCAAYGGFALHIRTTSFWMPPELLRSYPAYIGSGRKSRYEFEHGATSFTRHVIKLGFPCVMATWKGTFEVGQWENNAPNHREILVRDQHIHA